MDVANIVLDSDYPTLHAATDDLISSDTDSSAHDLRSNQARVGYEFPLVNRCRLEFHALLRLMTLVSAACSVKLT